MADCADALEVIGGARDAYETVIKSIIDTVPVVQCFVKHYRLLCTTSLNFLETAHVERLHTSHILVTLPLLRHLQCRDTFQRKQFLHWANTFVSSL